MQCILLTTTPNYTATGVFVTSEGDHTHFRLEEEGEEERKREGGRERETGREGERERGRVYPFIPTNETVDTLTFS